MASATSAEVSRCSETAPDNCDVATSERMNAELGNQTKNYNGQVRVMDAVKKDRFLKTVKINPRNLDIVFSFNLPHTYPDAAADVDVRCESLEEDDLFDLKTFLKQTSESELPRSLEKLVEIALQWLKEGGLDISGKKKSKVQKSDNGRHKSGKKKSKTKENEDKGKKPPMKTAMDVVKRIQWDRALPQDQFLVGYLDRLEGLKEKYFNVFSWEDIASVDYTVLAIPKHRIQYFKYKNEIVWDKRCRLDNVFGSTGSKTTITDVIRKIDGVAREENDEFEEQRIADEIEQVHVDEHHDSDFYDSEDCSDSDSDSDDGIEVTIGDGNALGAVGGKEINDDDNFNEYEDGIIGNSDETGQYDKYWRDKLRPNHFIAVRVTDETIRNMAEDIQKQVIDNEPRLTDCKIPRGAMHLTLCTMGLETPEQVQNAVDCLEEAILELKDILPKDKPLTLKGVETFFNRVIYGRVVDCPGEFYDLVDHLKTCLSAKGIDTRDYHEFVPHMTIMKVSRPVARVTGNNYIAPWLYSRFNDTVLGSQVVDNLHLCAMTDDRQEDGFYKTATSFQW